MGAITCNELIAVLKKAGNKTHEFARELSINGCDIAAPSRIPDLYRIDPNKKEINWIEIDGSHRTDKCKLMDLYHFADELIGEDWSFNLRVYVIHPLAVFVYEIRDMASPIEQEVARKSQLSDYIIGITVNKSTVTHYTQSQKRKMFERARFF